MSGSRIRRHWDTNRLDVSPEGLMGDVHPPMMLQSPRKTTWRVALAATLLLHSVFPGSGAEPRWILNNGRDILRLLPGQAECGYKQGLITITPTGPDATLTVPLAEEERFEAARYPFFALRYRYRTVLKQAGLFFTTDELATLSDHSYSPFPVQGDETWHDQIVDMRSFSHGKWKGRITGFRIDPTNPSDAESRLTMSRFGFFPSEAAARRFLSEADDKPDPAKETLFPKPAPARSTYPPKHFSRDRIRIGAWGNFRPVDLDEEYIETYASCGFDWLIAMPGISGSLLREPLFQWCDKYGIEVYIADGAFSDPVANTASYAAHPSYRGHYVVDEPGSDQFDKLAAVCNRYVELTGGKVPYVNLLPMYANAAQLKYGAHAASIQYYDADPDLFRKYCDAFCKKFRVGYICTDIYPLNWGPDGRTTYKDYVESINVIAASAREHHREFWCFIQTFAWTNGKRTPTEAEFRWQIYSLLSFGCKGILCWTYAGADPAFPSLVDARGRRTNSWYDAKTVFQEVRRISDPFVRYTSLGAFTHHATDTAPYLRMSNPCRDFATIEDIECDAPLLIGCFANKEGPGTAFTVVNMSELEEVKTVQPRLKVRGKRITAYPKGLPCALQPDARGFVKLTLTSGEGVFVTVDP